MFIKAKHAIYAILIVMYVLLGIYSVNAVTEWATKEYFSALGKSALSVAGIIANSYEITDKEVQELLALEFADAVKHPANVRFNKFFKGKNFSEEFRYAYVTHEIPHEEVKYRVTEKTADYYGAPPGTPLNFMWLLDAIVGGKELSGDVYHEDENRYSYMRSNDIEVYKNMVPDYVVTRDEYGSAITGLVPFHTKEGNFVGMIGIDINFEKFETHVGGVKNALIFVFLLPTIALTLGFAIFYFKKRKITNIEINTDPLTALHNRRYLRNNLPSFIKEHYKKHAYMSVIMIDIDFFKNYNDSYGHQKGDDVLVRISKAVSSVLRSGNDVICRYGGEEIIVILRNTALSGAINVAEKISDEIKKLCIDHKSSEVSDVLTVSQGIYSAVPLGIGKDVEHDFILRADEALYKAKKNGRDRYENYESE